MAPVFDPRDARFMLTSGPSPVLAPETFVAQPAPGRACGACTLCCKVYDVPAVESVAGQWCRHTKASSAK